MGNSSSTPNSAASLRTVITPSIPSLPYSSRPISSSSPRKQPPSASSSVREESDGSTTDLLSSVDRLVLKSDTKSKKLKRRPGTADSSFSTSTSASTIKASPTKPAQRPLPPLTPTLSEKTPSPPAIPEEWLPYRLPPYQEILSRIGSASVRRNQSLKEKKTNFILNSGDIGENSSSTRSPFRSPSKNTPSDHPSQHYSRYQKNTFTPRLEKTNYQDDSPPNLIRKSQVLNGAISNASFNLPEMQISKSLSNDDCFPRSVSSFDSAYFNSSLDEEIEPIGFKRAVPPPSPEEMGWQNYSVASTPICRSEPVESYFALQQRIALEARDQSWSNRNDSIVSSDGSIDSNEGVEVHVLSQQESNSRFHIGTTHSVIQVEFNPTAFLGATYKAQESTSSLVTPPITVAALPPSLHTLSLSSPEPLSIPKSRFSFTSTNSGLSESPLGYFDAFSCEKTLTKLEAKNFNESFGQFPVRIQLGNGRGREKKGMEEKRGFDPREIDSWMLQH